MHTDGILLETTNQCQIDSFDEYRNKDWLMDYYNNFQRIQKDSHRLRPCSKLTYFAISSLIPNRYLKYFNQAKYSIGNWSSANIELIQAIGKVIILVILKMILKYYVCGHLKTSIKNKAVYQLIDLLLKALTIAIAKIAIKWALYPALRTALKTMLIVGLKIILKPFIKRIKKDKKNEFPSSFDTIIKVMLSLTIKIIIKTIALHLLWLVFENNHVQQSLTGLLFRVSVIISVKMAAKRLCKLAKKKTTINDNNRQIYDTSSPPVDQILLFALQKLVTKLVKIPLIKILFE